MRFTRLIAAGIATCSVIGSAVGIGIIFANFIKIIGHFPNFNLKLGKLRPFLGANKARPHTAAVSFFFMMKSASAGASTDTNAVRRIPTMLGGPSPREDKDNSIWSFAADLVWDTYVNPEDFRDSSDVMDARERTIFKTIELMEKFRLRRYRSAKSLDDPIINTQEFSQMNSSSILLQPQPVQVLPPQPVQVNCGVLDNTSALLGALSESGYAPNL